MVGEDAGQTWQTQTHCKGLLGTSGRVSCQISKSESMVLNRKRVECTLRVGDEILPQVEEFKYLGV